jgi:outer membrane protein OmpA-like peptidoglycan-associated protein
VANALAKRGVPAGRLAVTGRGSAEPIVYPEQSSSDKARNRRVEVRVQF